MRVGETFGSPDRDERGRIVIVNPTYKPHWTSPAGRSRPTVRAVGGLPARPSEECGLDFASGRLACVDFLAEAIARRDALPVDCGVSRTRNWRRSRCSRRSSRSTPGGSRRHALPAGKDTQKTSPE